MPRGERAFGTQDAAAPSSVVGATSPPLLNDTIGSSLRSAVERYPTNPAVISAHQGVRRSYEQLWADVQAAARSLLAIGTCHGDRIALWAPTSLEWTVVQYAAASIGAILVTLNPAYRHSELAFALQSAEVAVLVLGETFKAESMVAVAQDDLLHQVAQQHLDKVMLVEAHLGAHQIIMVVEVVALVRQERLALTALVRAEMEQRHL